MKDYIKIARLDHWIKNAFIIPGIAVAILLLDSSQCSINILHMIIGFFATCFIASANYVINEWLDAEFDQFHPTKKHRPVVSQNMKFGLVMVEYAVLTIAGFACSIVINKYFLYMEI